VAAVAYFHRLLAPHGPNVIRLMERKLPKGTDLSVYSQAQLDQVSPASAVVNAEQSVLPFLFLPQVFADELVPRYVPAQVCEKIDAEHCILFIDCGCLAARSPAIADCWEPIRRNISGRLTRDRGSRPPLQRSIISVNFLGNFPLADDHRVFYLG